jgi:hypothetical protein
MRANQRGKTKENERKDCDFFLIAAAECLAFAATSAQALERYDGDSDNRVYENLGGYDHARPLEQRSALSIDFAPRSN